MGANEPEGKAGVAELENLGKRIAYLRKKMRMSQARFGEELGVTQSTVTQWENNMIVPRTEVLMPLSRLLQVSLEWLLAGEGGGPSLASGEVAAKARIAAAKSVPDDGLTALQLATVEVLTAAFHKKLVTNGRCLELLNEWQRLVDAED